VRGIAGTRDVTEKSGGVVGEMYVGGDSRWNEVVTEDSLVRKDVAVIGPPLNPRQLRNLLGLVFVEETEPPALIVLMDRVAMRWGPVVAQRALGVCVGEEGSPDGCDKNLLKSGAVTTCF